MNSSSPFAEITMMMNTQHVDNQYIPNGKPADLIELDALNSVKKALEFKSPLKKNSGQTSSSAAIDSHSGTKIKGSSNKKGSLL